MQLLVLAHQPCTGSLGDLERKPMVPLLVHCHFLPPPCTNFSNKSLMVGVMTKGHPDTDAPKPSSAVGCPPQNIVTLRRDPASPPPHLPDISPGIFSRTIDKNGWTCQPTPWRPPVLAIFLLHLSHGAARLMFKLPSKIGRHPQGHACHTCLTSVNVVRLFGGM